MPPPLPVDRQPDIEADGQEVNQTVGILSEIGMEANEVERRRTAKGARAEQSAEVGVSDRNQPTKPCAGSEMVN